MSQGTQTSRIFTMITLGALALVVFTIVLLLGLALVGNMAADIGETRDPFNKTASPNPTTGEAVSFEDTSHAAEIHEIFSVNDSTGYAIQLSGAGDSYVRSDQNVSIASDDTWTVSTWARVSDGAANDTMTAISANGRVLIEYNGTTGNWSAWYYDDGSRDSYQVEVSAPNQPENLTLVTATSNGTHFTIYANTTQGETADITSSSLEDSEINATNWAGTLEETKTYDDYTNLSEQQDLYDNPIAPKTDRNRTARLMYDEGSGSSTAIYFAGTTATISNGTWVNGLAGHELTEGSDYEIDQSSGTITALEGGRIDGAPVVWIDYRYEPLNRIGQIGSSLMSAFTLFGVGAIIIPAAVVLGVLVYGLIRGLRTIEMDGLGFNKRNGR